MRKDEKYTIERQTKRNYLFLRFKNGLYELIRNRVKGLITWAYLIIGLIAWYFRYGVLYLINRDIYAIIDTKMIDLAFPVILIVGLFCLLILFGTPFGSKRIHENLLRIGFVNNAGETPLLTKKYKGKKPGITVMEFESNGIPLSEWEKQQEKIEAVLNIHVEKIMQGTNMEKIVIYTVSGNRSLPEILYWKDEYLSKKSFELVLGESLLDRETVNLAKIPHILLGGSTGSGKSVLLKLLLMQCIKKGAKVYISDFKGGVDFGAWRDICNIITDKMSLLDTLNFIVNDLEKRKELFVSMGVSNIDDYNKINEIRMCRFIFACDEVAEILDKNGLLKEDKEIVAQIESKLSTIARQGRAFGIHLILATQRPDANILTGQVKNNINFRVCGRSDNVLSMIILDNADAADKIPIDAQGRFLTNNNILFQGYLLDENNMTF